MFRWRHDIQHNDILQNDFQHKQHCMMSPMLGVFMSSIVRLSAVRLNAIVLKDILLSVVKLSVAMLNVMAPF